MSWAMWRACGVACMVDTPLPPPDAPARELVPRTVPRHACLACPCENFLYSFKAAPTGPLAPPARTAQPDSAAAAPGWPLAPAGWREGEEQGR